MRKTGLIVIIITGIVFITNCKSAVSTAKMEEGKKVYDTNCGGCHMDNGMGVPRMNPALVNSPYVMSDASNLIKLVLQGSEFFGNAGRGYKNQMASFHALTDEQIASLLTYIRNNYAKTGDEISAEDVKNVRVKLK